MDEKGIILKDYIESVYIPYLEVIRSKPSSLKRDKGVLRIICSYSLVERCLGDINQNDLTMFFAKIKKERNLSKATINRYRSRLLAIFNHAIKAQLVVYNPVRHITRYKEESRDRILSHVEMQRFFEACEISSNQELYIVVLIALYTGMRYSEVLNLKKSAIHKNIIKLAASETKSGNKRDVVLNTYAKELLEKFIREHDNGEYVFKTKYIRRSFNTAVKRAELEDFRFHDLRRTFATYLLDSGANIRIIQNALGHSSIRMTESYLASNIKKRIDAIEKLCFII